VREAAAGLAGKAAASAARRALSYLLRLILEIYAELTTLAGRD
jgi:hypothetical protein